MKTLDKKRFFKFLEGSGKSHNINWLRKNFVEKLKAIAHLYEIYDNPTIEDLLILEYILMNLTSRIIDDLNNGGW